MENNNNNNEMVFIIILTIILISVSTILYIIFLPKTNTDYNVKNNSEKGTNENGINIIENNDNKKVEDSKIDDIESKPQPDTKSSSNTETKIENKQQPQPDNISKQENNNTGNTSNASITESIKEEEKNNTPSITYFCPEGYELTDKKCVSIVEANHVCPDNTHDYSNEDEGIPRDTYCVNLNEGYEIEGEDCPSGYGYIRQLGLGTPSKNICLLLHEKIYTCNEGYTLDGNKCINEIEANTN